MHFTHTFIYFVHAPNFLKWRSSKSGRFDIVTMSSAGTKRGLEISMIMIWGPNVRNRSNHMMIVLSRLYNFTFLMKDGLCVWCHHRKEIVWRHKLINFWQTAFWPW